MWKGHVLARYGGQLILPNAFGFLFYVTIAVVAVSPLSFANLSSFKYRGKVSEKLLSDYSKLIATEDGVIVRHAHPTVTDDNESSVTSAIIPSENISCPVLLIYGTNDLCLNSDFTVKQIYGRMEKNGRGHLCTVLCYPDAGHLIEPPYTPLCYSSFDPFARDTYGNPNMVWGGENKAHAHAQEDAWSNVLALMCEGEICLILHLSQNGFTQ